MKKVIASSLLAAAIVLSATPAMAKNDDNNGKKGENWGKIRRIFKGPELSATQFVVVGAVDSATTTSLLIKQTAAMLVPTITNGMVVVKIDGNTKITSNGKEAATIADLVKGINVVVTGSISGADLLATKIGIAKTIEKVEKKEKQKAAGKVTAKTDTSVTITNGLTNEAKTITTDADTKVVINGEVKALSDIQVGDSGWVKFKTVGSNLVAKVFRLFR